MRSFNKYYLDWSRIKQLTNMSYKPIIDKFKPSSNTNFIGQGYSKSITPQLITNHFLQNPNIYTPYTPYQSEISQGRLELLYNYQTMNNSFGYIDIILLGMIAGFIILRLRSILGRKTGHESKIYPSFAEKKFSIAKNDTKLIKQNLEILEGKNKKAFLKGAEIAYETILISFASGDLKKLKTLLASTMYNNFSGAIDARDKDKIKSEFTFIGIKESTVEKYEKVKDDLSATVKFVAEVISVKKKDDKIIEGNPDKIKFVTDVWKFTRNINNKSPNWYLAEIISK